MQRAALLGLLWALFSLLRLSGDLILACHECIEETTAWGRLRAQPEETAMQTSSGGSCRALPNALPGAEGCAAPGDYLLVLLPCSSLQPAPSPSPCARRLLGSGSPRRAPCPMPAALLCHGRLGTDPALLPFAACE